MLFHTLNFSFFNNRSETFQDAVWREFLNLCCELCYLSQRLVTYPRDWSLIPEIGHLSQRLVTYPRDWSLIPEIGHLSQRLVTYPRDWSLIPEIGHLSQRLVIYPRDWSLIKRSQRLVNYRQLPVMLQTKKAAQTHSKGHD